ncbi:imidazole glycerol phosphate synthase subunit HisF [Gammaproteobacteria bacterium]|nr:imidazole glycerol phosphate synthase subunit HisF [Gammaproteobacteria bacterium]
MLTKRIIPCLDVKNGLVVKGIQFKDHEIVGSILDLAQKYSNEGADELVFYDIGASTCDGIVSKEWVNMIAEVINIPFCVAGGIKTINDAREILNSGADKISINSPAIQKPGLIKELADEFGSQCVVVGIDSKTVGDKYIVFSHTGDEKTITNTELETKNWIDTVQELGAGEIVLNCMNQDGVRCGYDISQLNTMLRNCDIPLIASGGAGTKNHFKDVLYKTESSGALAASVFHKNIINIYELKDFLQKESIYIRC